MKKVYYFAAIVLALSMLFACTFPSSINIKGSPSLRFSANMDFNKLFSDSIKEAFSSSDSENTVVECTNTKYQTFIIHLNLFTNQIGIKLFDATEHLGGDANDNFTTILDEKLSDNSTDGTPDPISLESLYKNLEGFQFKEVNSRLFISGSNIVGELIIELAIGNEKLTLNRDTGFVPSESGFNESEWEKFTALPNRGESIDLTNVMNSGQDVEIEYDIILPGGRTFPVDWVYEEAKIKAELVVWLSLELTAKNECEHEGADLNLTDFIGDMEDDFFGRESADGEGSITNFFESINLAIEFSQDAFNGATMYIESDKGSKPINISYKLTEKQLNLKFDEETMKKINDPAYFPFTPKIFIHFDKGGDLHIPRVFKSNFLSFEAKLNYTVDFSGNNK